jgi:aspartyl-tRNA(Asn)/glutamyl-tRNA(Gln) amidotransferase subunit C
MPSPFSIDEVAAIAALAHLDLDPAELELYARQLRNILAHVEEVQQIDTTGVPPTAHVVGCQPSERVDEVSPSLDTQEALANAPERGDSPRGGGFFKVPRVIT